MHLLLVYLHLPHLLELLLVEALQLHDVLQIVELLPLNVLRRMLHPGQRLQDQGMRGIVELLLRDLRGRRLVHGPPLEKRHPRDSRGAVDGDRSRHLHALQQVDVPSKVGGSGLPIAGRGGAACAARSRSARRQLLRFRRLLLLEELLGWFQRGLLHGLLRLQGGLDRGERLGCSQIRLGCAGRRLLGEILVWWSGSAVDGSVGLVGSAGRVNRSVPRVALSLGMCGDASRSWRASRRVLLRRLGRRWQLHARPLRYLQLHWPLLDAASARGACAGCRGRGSRRGVNRQRRRRLMCTNDAALGRGAPGGLLGSGALRDGRQLRGKGPRGVRALRLERLAQPLLVLRGRLAVLALRLLLAHEERLGAAGVELARAELQLPRAHRLGQLLAPQRHRPRRLPLVGLGQEAAQLLHGRRRQLREDLPADHVRRERRHHERRRARLQQLRHLEGAASLARPLRSSTTVPRAVRCARAGRKRLHCLVATPSLVGGRRGGGARDQQQVLASFVLLLAVVEPKHHEARPSACDGPLLARLRPAQDLHACASLGLAWAQPRLLFVVVVVVVVVVVLLLLLLLFPLALALLFALLISISLFVLIGPLCQVLLAWDAVVLRDPFVHLGASHAAHELPTLQPHLVRGRRDLGLHATDGATVLARSHAYVVAGYDRRLRERLCLEVVVPVLLGASHSTSRRHAVHCDRRGLDAGQDDRGSLVRHRNLRWPCHDMSACLAHLVPGHTPAAGGLGGLQRSWDRSWDRSVCLCASCYRNASF